jgi:hypothetical protein
VDVPTALAHLVVGDGLAAIFLANPADHGIEPNVARAAPFVEPVLDALFIATELGHQVLVLNRCMVVIHRRRLDDMVVDADDDHVFEFHVPVPLWRALRTAQLRCCDDRLLMTV